MNWRPSEGLAESVPLAVTSVQPVALHLPDSLLPKLLPRSRLSRETFPCVSVFLLRKAKALFFHPRGGEPFSERKTLTIPRGETPCDAVDSR